VRLSTDLGTWGFILSIVAILLMYPMGLLINMTTPAVQNWIASRTKSSLIKRIALLENKLAELEKAPPITEVEDEILWRLQSVKIGVIGAANGVIFVFYFGMKSLTGVNVSVFADFQILVLLALVVNLIMQLRLRYEKDLRMRRSPRVRANLRKSIEELKAIRDSWL
jgi:hypothetical protein